MSLETGKEKKNRKGALGQEWTTEVRNVDNEDFNTQKKSNRKRIKGTRNQVT